MVRTATLKRISISMIALCPLLWGCDNSTGKRPDGVVENAQPAADIPDIPLVEGNEGHNLIARMPGVERSMALAQVIKTVWGKQRCSVERSMYQGASKDGTAYWNAECHDGADFVVQIKRDGSGGVVPCEIAGRRDIAPCWEKWKGISS